MTDEPTVVRRSPGRSATGTTRGTAICIRICSGAARRPSAAAETAAISCWHTGGRRAEGMAGDARTAGNSPVSEPFEPLGPGLQIDLDPALSAQIRSSFKSGVMLDRLNARVETLWSMAEDAGGRIPSTPNRIRLKLKAMIRR